MDTNLPIEQILDQALARYTNGESLEAIVGSFPQQREEVEAFLITIRTLELERGRVEPDRNVLAAALRGESVTNGLAESYRESEDTTKGRVLAHVTPSVYQSMWKVLVPVAAVVAVIIAVVALRPGGVPVSTTSLTASDPDEAAFNEIALAVDGNFAVEDELILALNAAENPSAAVSAAPAAGDPLDSAGINSDATSLDKLGIDQFLNEQSGLEGDLQF